MGHVARRRARRLAMLTFVAYAALQLWGADVRRAEPLDDQVAMALSTYRRLADDLPAGGTVGFLATLNDPTLDVANYFVAQYALAPRVFLHGLDGVDVVITGVAAAPDTARDARLANFELIAVGDWGVQIFREKKR